MATFTLDQYNALNEAYALGILSVSYAGKNTVYRSLQEMRDLLSEMEVQLGINQSNGTTRLHANFDSELRHKNK